MAEFIKLQKRIMQIFKGEMRCNDIRIGVVGWMLDGTKIIDFIFLGNYDNSARMLSRRALDADTFFRQTVKLRFAEIQISFFRILGRIAVCGFIGDAADCTGAEYVFSAEQLFCIFMYLSLNLPGKIEVDIR